VAAPPGAGPSLISALASSSGGVVDAVDGLAPPAAAAAALLLATGGGGMASPALLADLAEGLEEPVQLVYLVFLLGFLVVGAYLVVRQVR